MPNIILVDTSHTRQDQFWTAVRGHNMTMIFCYSAPDATIVFEANPDFNAIIIGPYYEGPTHEIVSFVEHVRKAGYEGHIIANSSILNNEKLIEAGCDHSIAYNIENNAPVQLLEMLRVTTG